MMPYNTTGVRKRRNNYLYYINCSGRILGDRKKLSRVFYELIKNAKMAF